MEKSRQELRSLQKVDRFDSINLRINKRRASSRASSFQELISSKRSKIPPTHHSPLPNTCYNLPDHHHHRAIISDDPIPSVQDQKTLMSEPIPATNGIPPRAPKNSTTPGIKCCCEHQESPNTWRLKRITDRLREMKQWWDEVVREDNDEDVIGDQLDDTKISKAQVEEIEEPPTPPPPPPSSSEEEEEEAEAVWVEKMDKDCLALHFKCPCGSAHQLVLSGSNCYYRSRN